MERKSSPLISEDQRDEGTRNMIKLYQERERGGSRESRRKSASKILRELAPTKQPLRGVIAKELKRNRNTRSVIIENYFSCLFVCVSGV